MRPFVLVAAPLVLVLAGREQVYAQSDLQNVTAEEFGTADTNRLVLGAADSGRAPR